MSKRALILVDIQKDFLAGGALAVPGADENYLNKLVNFCKSHEFDYVVFTVDHHPANHRSFASQHPGKNVFDVIDLNGIQQVLWPDHCVIGTKGGQVQLYPTVETPLYIYKGMNPEIDSYSAFLENDKKTETGFDQILKKLYVTDLTIGGLALDYCVKYTCLDAVSLGYKVTLKQDLCRSINDPQEALDQLQEAGVVLD